MRDKNPIRLGTLILFGLLSISAVILGVSRLSYLHPGPAIAAGGLAIIVLVVGWVLAGLWRARFVSHTRVLGLEFLADRWQSFEPKERDSVILYEQISIVLSIAELAYHNVDEIHLLRAFPGTKFKSGAFVLQPGKGMPHVLKLDSVANIKEEEKRYQHCVAGRLGRVAGEPWVPRHRNGKIEGQDWGAIAYNLAGAGPSTLDRLQSFGKYYLAHDNSQQIEDALGCIFEALRPWWQNAKVENDPCASFRRTTLRGEYDRLTRKQRQMETGIRQVGQALQIQTLQAVDADQRYVDLEGDIRLGNPLNWVRDVFEAEQPGTWITQDTLRRDSIVHGDLHANNILISQEMGGQLAAWVIDFPHTHVGPTVQDVARLEADIKFGLLPDDSLRHLSMGDMWHFEVSILPQSDQFPPPMAALTPGPIEQADQQLHKAHNSVCLLRNEARKYMSGDNACPYYLALLHATLPILYYRDRTPRQKLYAFISAALVCERLSG